MRRPKREKSYVAASNFQRNAEEQQREADKVEQVPHEDNQSVLTASTNYEDTESEILMTPRRETLVDQWSSMKALSQLQASSGKKNKSPKVEEKKMCISDNSTSISEEDRKKKEEKDDRGKQYLVHHASPRHTRRSSFRVQSPRRRRSSELSSPSSPLVPESSPASSAGRKKFSPTSSLARKQFSPASPRFRKHLSPGTPLFRKSLPSPDRHQQQSEEKVKTKTTPPLIDDLQSSKREDESKDTETKQSKSSTQEAEERYKLKQRRNQPQEQRKKTTEEAVAQKIVEGNQQQRKDPNLQGNEPGKKSSEEVQGKTSAQEAKELETQQRQKRRKKRNMQNKNFVEKSENHNPVDKSKPGTKEQQASQGEKKDGRRQKEGQASQEKKNETTKRRQEEQHRSAAQTTETVKTSHRVQSTNVTQNHGERTKDQRDKGIKTEKEEKREKQLKTDQSKREAQRHDVEQTGSTEANRNKQVRGAKKKPDRSRDEQLKQREPTKQAGRNREPDGIEPPDSVVREESKQTEGSRRKSRDPDGIIVPNDHYNIEPGREEHPLGTPPLSPLPLRGIQHSSRRRREQTTDQHKTESSSPVYGENCITQPGKTRKNQDVDGSKSRVPTDLRVETEALSYDLIKNGDPALEGERWLPPPSPKRQSSGFAPPPPPPRITPDSSSRHGMPQKYLETTMAGAIQNKEKGFSKETEAWECDTPKARGARGREMSFEKAFNCEIPMEMSSSEAVLPSVHPSSKCPPPPPPPPPLSLKNTSKLRRIRCDVPENTGSETLLHTTQCDDTEQNQPRTEHLPPLSCPHSLPPPPPPPISLKSPPKHRNLKGTQLQLTVITDPENDKSLPPPPPPMTPPPQRASPRKKQRSSVSNEQCSDAQHGQMHESADKRVVAKGFARQDIEVPPPPPPRKSSATQPNCRGELQKEQENRVQEGECESIYSSLAENFSIRSKPRPPSPKSQATATHVVDAASVELQEEINQSHDITVEIPPCQRPVADNWESEAEKRAFIDDLHCDKSRSEEKKEDPDSFIDYSCNAELPNRSAEPTRTLFQPGRTETCAKTTCAKPDTKKALDVDDRPRKGNSRLRNTISWPERLDKVSDSGVNELNAVDDNMSIKQILTSKVEGASHRTESYIKHQVLKQKSQWMVKFQGRAPPISGVNAAKAIVRWSKHTRKGRNFHIPDEQHWKLSYEERTKAHPGYLLVDVYSLYDSAMVKRDFHSLDPVAWEERDVKQRFLYEKSISFSRNWFGDLLRKRGNDRYREPVCEPHSMLLHNQTNVTQAENSDWYSIWQSQNNRLKLSGSTCSESDSGSHSSTGTTYDFLSSAGETADFSGLEDYETDSDSSSSSSSCSTQGDENDDDASYEEVTPECGTIRNVRQKIGERVSRVHPDHTSSLRQSRFRKKWFPRGTFPY